MWLARYRLKVALVVIRIGLFPFLVVSLVVIRKRGIGGKTALVAVGLPCASRRLRLVLAVSVVILIAL